MCIKMTSYLSQIHLQKYMIYIIFMNMKTKNFFLHYLYIVIHFDSFFCGWIYTSTLQSYHLFFNLKVDNITFMLSCKTFIILSFYYVELLLFWPWTIVYVLSQDALKCFVLIWIYVIMILNYQICNNYN